MAYVFNPSLTDEENKKRQQDDAGRAAGGVIGSAGDMSAGAQPPNTPSSSGSFVNLQKYLAENVPQSDDLAQKIGQGITKSGEAARTASEDLVNTVGANIESNRVKPSGIVDEAAKNAPSVSSDPTRRASFIRERDANYSGPTGLEEDPGFSNVQSLIKSAKDRIGLSETEPGRTELLRELSAPGTGRGKLALNQLLLGAAPNAREIVSSAAKPYGNLENYLTSGSESTRKRAVDAATEAAATQKTLKDRFIGPGGVVPSFVGGLDQRVTDARSGAQGQWDSISKKLDDLSPLTDQELSLIGLTRPELDRMYQDQHILKDVYGDPLPSSQFLRQTSSPDLITRENLGTSDDYAMSAALADLLGDQPGLLNASTKGQAGTAVTDLGDIDQTGIEGPYKGITFAGKAKLPLADTMAKLNELDAKSANDLGQLFIGMEGNRLHGAPLPTISPQDRVRLQSYIDRNYNSIPLSPEVKTILFQKFGFTAPTPPTPATPKENATPVLPNPYPPGGDVGHGTPDASAPDQSPQTPTPTPTPVESQPPTAPANPGTILPTPYVPPVNNRNEIVGTTVLGGLTGGTYPITRGQVEDSAKQSGISFEEALYRMTHPMFRSDARDKKVSKDKPDMEEFLSSLRPLVTR